MNMSSGNSSVNRKRPLSKVVSLDSSSDEDAPAAKRRKLDNSPPPDHPVRQRSTALRCLKSRIQKLQNEKFHNITFVVGKGKREFGGNRTIFASLSDAFEKLLFGEMQESAPNACIPLPHIEEPAFQCVHDFAYGKSPNLSHENFVQVLSFADTYGIEELSTICAEYFHRNVDPDNVCQYFDGFLKLESQGYKKCCEKYIKFSDSERLSSIVESASFLNMSLESMQQFLSYDFLEIDEDKLFKRVCEWSKYRGLVDNTSELEHLRAVKRFVRFPVMDGEFLVNEVMKQYKDLFTSQERDELLMGLWQTPYEGHLFSTRERGLQISDAHIAPIHHIIDKNATKGYDYLTFTTDAAILLCGFEMTVSSGAFCFSIDDDSKTLGSGTCLGADGDKSVCLFEKPVMLNPETEYSIDLRRMRHLYKPARKSAPGVQSTLKSMDSECKFVAQVENVVCITGTTSYHRIKALVFHS